MVFQQSPGFTRCFSKLTPLHLGRMEYHMPSGGLLVSSLSLSCAGCYMRSGGPLLVSFPRLIPSSAYLCSSQRLSAPMSLTSSDHWGCQTLGYAYWLEEARIGAIKAQNCIDFGTKDCHEEARPKWEEEQLLAFLPPADAAEIVGTPDGDPDRLSLMADLRRAFELESAEWIVAVLAVWQPPYWVLWAVALMLRDRTLIFDFKGTQRRQYVCASMS